MCYGVRWNDVGEENCGENFDPWTERVASRTLEGLEGHGVSTQVEGNEQTRRHRLAVQTRAVSQAPIGADLRRRGEYKTLHYRLMYRQSARVCKNAAHMEVQIHFNWHSVSDFLDARGYRPLGKDRNADRTQGKFNGTTPRRCYLPLC